MSTSTFYACSSVARNLWPPQRCLSLFAALLNASSSILCMSPRLYLVLFLTLALSTPPLPLSNIFARPAHLATPYFLTVQGETPSQEFKLNYLVSNIFYKRNIFHVFSGSICLLSARMEISHAPLSCFTPAFLDFLLPLALNLSLRK